MVIPALTRNFWKLRPFRPLKMSAAQGFARVRISQFHIVLACFSCIPPEQGSHLSNTESCPSGRRCSTRNAVDRKVSRVRIPNSPPKTQSYQGFRPYDWAFLFSQGQSAYMIFGKNSGMPAGLPCVRQSQDIVHYICRGDLGFVIQVGVDICRGGEVTVSQPLLDLLQRHIVRQKQ